MYALISRPLSLPARCERLSVCHYPGYVMYGGEDGDGGTDWLYDSHPGGSARLIASAGGRVNWNGMHDMRRPCVCLTLRQGSDGVFSCNNICVRRASFPVGYKIVRRP